MSITEKYPKLYFSLYMWPRTRMLNGLYFFIINGVGVSMPWLSPTSEPNWLWVAQPLYPSQLLFGVVLFLGSTLFLPSVESVILEFPTNIGKWSLALGVPPWESWWQKCRRGHHAQLSKLSFLRVDPSFNIAKNGQNIDRCICWCTSTYFNILYCTLVSTMFKIWKNTSKNVRLLNTFLPCFPWI